MDYVNKTFLVIAGLLILLTGCAKPMDRLYPLPDRWLMVYDDKIYQEDKLFAELRYFGKLNECRYQGLSIYYYQYDKEVWIYPKGGWHLIDIPENKKYTTLSDIKKQYQKALETEHYAYVGGMLDTAKICLVRGDDKRKPYSFAPMPYVFNAHFSDDGRYVLYKESGMLFDSSNKYLVEYGISK